MYENRYGRFHDYVRRNHYGDYCNCTFDNDKEEVFCPLSDGETAYLFFTKDKIYLGSIDMINNIDMGYIDIPIIMTDDWLWYELTRNY